jgi:hypothetical protein
MAPKRKPQHRLARVKSKYHSGTQKEHRLRSKKKLEAKLTPCGVRVHHCVMAKKAACRKRSRELIAQKMGLRVQDLTVLYPNHDVHHEKRMTFKAKKGCKCSLSCPLNSTSLVPASWNRGAMKHFETNIQRGYSFEDQMRGVPKSNGNSQTAPPPQRPDSSMSTGHRMGSCTARSFSNAINKRVEGRAYARYCAIVTTSKKTSTANHIAVKRKHTRKAFTAATKVAHVKLHTIPALRAMMIRGGGVHLLHAQEAASAPHTKRPKLMPIVVLRSKGGTKPHMHLLDGKRRIRDAHDACPARAKVAVMFVDA